MMPRSAFSRSYEIPKSKQSEDLRVLIQSLVMFLEENVPSAHGITFLSNKFQIKRRRLYDVVNVFISIGCCKKALLDQITWEGKSAIMSSIQGYVQSHHIYDPTKSISELFPTSACVGISNLTISFLMLFYALGVSRLDLRYVAEFLSRDTTRYKTTLCKLYQICYILGALGMMSRTNLVSEVILNPQFSPDGVLSPKQAERMDFMSIDSLLNRPQGSRIDASIEERRLEFNKQILCPVFDHEN